MVVSVRITMEFSSYWSVQVTGFIGESTVSLCGTEGMCFFLKSILFPTVLRVYLSNISSLFIAFLVFSGNIHRICVEYGTYSSETHSADLRKAKVDPPVA